MTDPTREDPPHCFGGPLWDPKSKECAGGIDPAFTDENGSHVRPKCMFFEACGAKLQASRMEPARALIDPKSLVRTNGVPTLSPVRPVQQQQQQPTQFVEKFLSSLAQQQVAITPYVPQMPQQVIPQKPIHLPPQQVLQQYAQLPIGYQQMMPVNYQMPGYLTVPEIRQPDQSFWTFLTRTVLRAMGKSFGHSIAHLFDTVPLSPPPPPYGNGGSSSGG